MKKNQVINWGIMGCGKIAHKFSKDLRSVPNANLHAVASRNTEKAEKFSKQYDASRFYGTYLELCKDPLINVIYIATPHVFHYENTLLCIHHKKAVLCEKPFAMNKEQVLEMISSAKKNQVFLMEALWTYFLPHYVFALDIIRSNQLGKVKKLKADFGFAAPFNPNERLFNKELGGGSLLDVGIYPLFAALTILGYPKNIEAQTTIGTTKVDENCTITLYYNERVTAHLFSSITEETKTEVIVACEKGKLMIDGRFHEPSSVTISKDNNNSKTYNFDVQTNGYNYEAMHVQEMLLDNRKESTIMTFEKSEQLIELLDKVRNKIGLQYDQAKVHS